MFRFAVRLFVLVAFVGIMTGLLADTIPEQKIKQVALNWLDHKNKEEDRSLKLGDIKPIFYQGEIVLYLCDLEENGFILLSADSNSKPVLAYSLENRLIVDQENLTLDLLQEYYKKSVYQIMTGKIKNNKYQAEWKRYAEGEFGDGKGKSVAPLTVSKWGQGSGFNRFCPPGCPAGCGTIAIAQYMYFYKFPIQGEGSHSYVPQDHPEYGTLSADFGSTTYNWDQMSATASDNYNATLIYHVAVAGEARFDPSGTFIHPARIPYLFRTYFRYTDNVSTKYRDDCSETEWNDYMTQELDKGCIVLYNGYSYVGDPPAGTNAHYFLLDGYNSENHFHINWGWNGSSNGYYYLNSLVTHGGTYDWATFGNRVFTNAYPQDHIIVSNVSPTPGTVLLLETESETFSVSAHHTEGNPLNYRWKVDGNLQSSSSSFVFNTDYDSQGSYQLTLDVFDSGKKDKGSISLEWNIVVKDKDRPIVITDLTPADQDFNPIDQITPIDGELDFSISAYDPDGNGINYRWELDNDSVSATDSYQFVADGSLAGEHDLSLTVHDFGAGLLFYEGFENGELSSVWNTGGDTDWQVSGEGGVWGDFSVKSGDISDNQETEISMNIEIKKFGQVNFYKKVSSESGAGNDSFYDGLYFYIDDIEIEKWQGESDWSESSYPLTIGTHELKWKYGKDPGASAGADCAWIDEIIVYDYDIETLFSDGFETGTLSSVWESGGNSEWFVTDTESSAGIYSVKSGVISDNQETELWTSVYLSATGEISFYKKISSESGAPSSFYDGLYFYVDGALKGRWQGESSWSESSYPLEAGSHELKWSYKKDAGTSSGEDCVWLDEINITTGEKEDTKNVISKNWKITVNISGFPPQFNPISNQNADEGQLVSFTAQATDPDGDEIRYFILSGAVAGMELDSLSGNFVWQTDYADAGVYILNIIAKSGDPVLSDTVELMITVTDVDQEIIIHDLQPLTGDTIKIIVPDSICFSVAASDPDGNSLNYNWKLDNNEVSTDSSYLFIANSSLIGTHSVDLNIDDLASGSVFSEDFENGEFGSEWISGGNEGWFVTENESNSGTYSAKSGDINDNQNSELKINIEILNPGQLKFYKKVSSESGAPSGFYDGLYFYIDGVEKGRWQGEIDWSESSYFLEAGVYELKWIYLKDPYVSQGADCAWLDDIVVDSDLISNFAEDFEGGTISSDWSHGGDEDWLITDSEFNSGTYAIRSGEVNDGQSSEIMITVIISQPAQISFYKKVSSESGASAGFYDGLYFYVDGVEKGKWQGEVDWLKSSYAVEAGSHELKWIYLKDPYVSEGADCAWLDDIKVETGRGENKSTVSRNWNIVVEGSKDNPPCFELALLEKNVKGSVLSEKVATSNFDLKKNIIENDILSFSVHATDPDGDLVKYQLSGAVKAGMELDSLSGKFNWQTTYLDPGNYFIDITAYSGEPSLFDTIKVCIDVAERSAKIPDNITLFIQDSIVNLSWDKVTGSSYKVISSDAAFKDFGDWLSEKEIVKDSNWQDVLTGSLKFYSVASVSGNTQSAYSEKIGVCPYQIGRGRYSTIALPFNSDISSASDLFLMIDNLKGVDLESISCWDREGKQWRQYLKGYENTDFKVSRGNSFLLYNRGGNSAVWVAAGKVVDPAVYDIAMDAYTQIMIPLNRPEITSAGSLVKAIERESSASIQSVSWWDGSENGWKQYLPNSPHSDFKLKAGDGVLIYNIGKFVKDWNLRKSILIKENGDRRSEKR